MPVDGASLGRVCWDRAHAATVAEQRARMERIQSTDPSEQLAAACEEQWGGPRDDRLVAEFLRHSIGPGDWLLFGAGTHTEKILPTLRSLSGIRLTGILDRAGATLGERFGLPVLPPEAALDHPDRPILISHQEFEPQMRRTLLRAGVAPQRIQTIYGNPDYMRMTAGGWRSQGLPPGPVDAVVISFGRSNWQVLSDETLAGWLPQDRTVRLFAGKPQYRPDASLFPVVDACQSAAWVGGILRSLAPKIIYLQTTFQICTARWFALLRRECPGTPIVHEIYDWMATLPAYQAMGQFHYDETELEDGLTAEALTAMAADVVVHKCGGRWWKPLEQPFRTRAIQFFPVVSPRAAASTATVEPAPRQVSAPASEQRPIRLLYAGSLPYKSEIEQWAAELNIIDLARRITGSAAVDQPSIEVHIYNLVHRTPEQDIHYSSYLAQSGSGMVHYHRGVDWPTMVNLMSDFDFGLCALDFPYEPPRLMDALAIANKFPSYIHGGLPVIVNRQDIYTAALVRRFKAGLVSDSNDGKALAHQIRTADRKRLQAGAKRLHAYMARFNSRSLERLRRMLPLLVTP